VEKNAHTNNNIIYLQGGPEKVRTSRSIEVI